MHKWKLPAGILASSCVAMLTFFIVGPKLERARAQPASPPASLFAYVGSFTTAERKARGDGIHVYRVESSTGLWTHTQHIRDLMKPVLPRTEPRPALSLFSAR